MNSIIITKIFSFEAAHALLDYDGPCRNIHGHSYKLWVSVSGEIDPKSGMILDFGDLKSIVNEVIISKYDHSLMLSADDEKTNKTSGLFLENLIVLPFNPSSENLIIYFSELINESLPARIRLFKLKLYETETSFAEWYSYNDVKSIDLIN